ncbi:MAG: PKD domain-containing protein [Candidatus Woesearchaeota archaeon]
MNKSLIKNSILALFSIGFAIVLFTPSAVDASFIKITVSAKKLNANGTYSPMSGVSVSAASDSSSDHRWWDGANCHSCNTQSLSATTDADGKDAESGMACGLSDCPSPHIDNGKCGPYTIKATAVASGDYDSDISYWDTPAGIKRGLNGSYTTSYSDMSNGVNYPFNFVFNGRKDRLSGTKLTAKVGGNGDFDCSKLVPNTATVQLTAEVNHDVFPLGSHLFTFEFDFGDGHKDTKTVSGGKGKITATSELHTFDDSHWSSIFSVNPPDSKNLNASVKITDRGFNVLGKWYPRTASASTTYTISKYTRTLYCGSVSANPVVGVIPLTVSFQSYIEDNWLCGSVPQYDWNFGDGTIKNNIGPNTVYTYVIENISGFNPFVTGISDGLSQTCPLGVKIRSQEWADTNFQEVAP